MGDRHFPAVRLRHGTRVFHAQVRSEEAEAVVCIYLRDYGSHFVESRLCGWIQDALTYASYVRGKSVDAVGVYSTEIS